MAKKKRKESQANESQGAVRTMRLGPFDYELRVGVLDLQHGTIGELDPQKLEIRTALLAPEQLRNTLWHEAFHHFFNVAFPDHAEEMVCVAADAAMQILRDNPWMGQSFD